MRQAIEQLDLTSQLAPVSHGDRRRHAILSTAVQIASAEGLEGLTIGRLASELKMSKSGLFAHFGSKEELQLATIDAARYIFISEVVAPAMKAKAGLPRMWKLCEIWLAYADREVFRGGCFFAAASAEFDSRMGTVRDRIAAIMREWLNLLEATVREAQELGHLRKEIDPAQLAFEINALAMGANWAFQLFNDRQAFAKVSAAVRQRLHAAATGKTSIPRLARRVRATKQVSHVS